MEIEHKKSTACKKVLQLMDSVEEVNYSEILEDVVAETGVNKEELEKELNIYI